MRILAILSLVAFLVVGVTVGVRLLLLARRSRQLPELTIGLGLVLIALVGMPLSMVGRLPDLVATPIGDGIFAVGLQVACAGIGLLYAFTRRVFRPEDAWARGIVAIACIALAVCCVGLLWSSTRGTSMAEILPHTRPWAIGIIGTVYFAFLWTGLESAFYYRRLRRRLALDLADAVVVNRFLLWALSGFIVAVLCAALVFYLMRGMVILLDPVGVSTVAAAGVSASVTWYLAFLPPKRYLRFLRGETAESVPA